MAELVTSESRRYLHGIQKETNDTTELPYTVPVDNQVTYIDSFTNYGVDTVYGHEYVIASGSSPTVHNALPGRSDADAHPASAIANTPAGNIAATTVQAAINELDSEKEPSLGNPSADGHVLSSTVSGARSWVAPGTQTYDAIVTVLGFEPLSPYGFGVAFGVRFGGR